MDSPAHTLHALAVSLECALRLQKRAVPVYESTQLIRPTSSRDPRACMVVYSAHVALGAALYHSREVWQL